MSEYGTMSVNEQLQREIDRLKAELESAKASCKMSFDQICELNKQLAEYKRLHDMEITRSEVLACQNFEARAENEKLTNMLLYQDNTSMEDTAMACREARKQTAGEIIQYIIDQGIIEVGWNKQQVYEIDRSDIDELRQRYGLEG